MGIDPIFMILVRGSVFILTPERVIARSDQPCDRMRSRQMVLAMPANSALLSLCSSKRCNYQESLVEDMLPTVEQSTMRKVYLRILPFAVLTYFFCYLDRINVGFASLTMNKDLGLDASMVRHGRRRVLLGLRPVRGPEQHHPRKGRRAHLDRPHHDHLGDHFGRHCFRDRPLQLHGDTLPARSCRGRPLPRLCACISPTGSPISIAPASIPVSPWLCRSRWPTARRFDRAIGLDGLWGLRGGRVMYIVEAIPTVLIGIGVFFYLTDRPSEARWLHPKSVNG